MVPKPASIRILRLDLEKPGSILPVTGFLCVESAFITNSDRGLS